MKYAVCLIDDHIPVIDKRVAETLNPTQKLHSSDINLLLKHVPQAEWEEQEVQGLLSSLLSSDKFSVSAFTHPNFYFNYNAYEGVYRPEVFILDWDLGDAKSTDEYLIAFLEFGFSLICIYTRVDKKHEIDTLITTDDKFKKYKNRIHVIHKEENDSIGVLLKFIEDENAKNFSFRFGKELRNKSTEATEKILIELGKTTYNQISNYFAFHEDATDLTDFLAERFKNYLSGIDFESLKDSKPIEHNDVEKEIAKDFWSYRIYFYGNNSKKIKRGDIINDTSNDTFFLVVSADCDLNMFWDKNSGNINLLPLHILSSTNEVLKSRLTATRKIESIKTSTVDSLTGRINQLPEDHFILPFVKWKGAFIDFWGIPQELVHNNIVPPEGKAQKELKSLPMTYDLLNNYHRIATISEPFITPLIQKILGAIAGFGVPNYHPIVKKIISDNIKGMFE